MSTKEVDEQLLNLPKELILFSRVDLHHHQGSVCDMSPKGVKDGSCVCEKFQGNPGDV